MEYILIGVLAIVVFGLRSTVMDMYDRIYLVEQVLKELKKEDEE